METITVGTGKVVYGNSYIGLLNSVMTKGNKKQNSHRHGYEHLLYTVTLNQLS